MDDPPANHRLSTGLDGADEVLRGGLQPETAVRFGLDVDGVDRRCEAPCDPGRPP